MNCSGMCLMNAEHKGERTTAVSSENFASFGDTRLRCMDRSKRTADSHLPEFSHAEIAALKMITSSSHSPVLHTANTRVKTLQPS